VATDRPDELEATVRRVVREELSGSLHRAVRAELRSFVFDILGTVLALLALWVGFVIASSALGGRGVILEKIAVFLVGLFMLTLGFGLLVIIWKSDS
jgi:uncharacterized membrane protein